MSYGSNVEVLGPEELKQQVKDELEKTLKKYS
jgi:predicted DNA-binding transcriptional regulator YafY